MRKCWRQHLHDGFGVSPHHVFVYQCVFVLFVGLSHSQCVLVSLRNGKCVKTIQLHIWEIRSFLCHSAGSRYRFGLRMWDKTNTNTHTCIHGHKHTSYLLIPSHISHSIYIPQTIVVHLLWVYMISAQHEKGYNQNCSTFVRCCRRLTAPPSPPNCLSIKNVPNPHFRFLGLINRPYTLDVWLEEIYIT